MCFDLNAVLHLLIVLIVIGALFAIIRLVVPRFLAAPNDMANLVLAILNILIWAAVLIAILVIVFEVLACLLGGGASLSVVPRR